MKNHIRVDGRLLQSNKRYSSLKAAQKEWIGQLIKSEFDSMVSERGREPDKKRRDILIDRIYDKITERGIWIPHHEAEPVIRKKILQLTRKYAGEEKPMLPESEGE